ncbi:tetratricopeptide repeat protein [Rhodobacteraceae bacterium]|nr:tetratricopeptide repeat protein [Paracoccaceae bacterium]
MVQEASVLTRRYPKATTLWNILGVSSAQIGSLDQAIIAFQKLTILEPDYVEAYNNIGIALKAQGKLGEAIEFFTKALSLKPDYAEAYYNMGNAFKDSGMLTKAIEVYSKSVLLQPKQVEAFINMGSAFKDLGKLDEAIESYEKALYLKPDSAETYYNIGSALQNQGKLDEAIENYKCALKLKPEYADVHINLSFALLNNNRIKEGLNEYEWRFKSAQGLSYKRYFSKPLWDGNRDLQNKTILLWSEQGPGDVIIWISALHYMVPIVKSCIVECPKKLLPLLQRSFPEVQVRVENQHKKEEDFDIHLPIGSLFRQFLSEINTRQKVRTYLFPDPVRITYWKERLEALGGALFIGISWKSPLMTAQRLPNYTSIGDWEPILSIPNVTFINLQSKDFEEDLDQIKKQFGITVHNFDDLNHYDDLDDVAALCKVLGMCVSVSTAVSTITSAVGTTTKMLHWRQSSWNNILNTPQGPFVDVFERNTWETWEAAFEEIASDIKLFMKTER